MLDLDARPRSRPRRRHRQTSRNIRRHPRRIRHRTRRQPRPPRLPHPQPRHRLRLRPRPGLAAPAAAPARRGPGGTRQPHGCPAERRPAGSWSATTTPPRRSRAGCPTAVLRPDLDVCAPTGVTIDDDSRIVVMIDQGGVGKALVKRLEKLGAAVLGHRRCPRRRRPARPHRRIGRTATTSRASTGCRHSTSKPRSPTWTSPRGGRRCASASSCCSATMRHLYETIGEPGTFLVTATRLGGRHGYDDDGAVAPMGGAVSGFTKAFKREKPDAW